MRRFSDIKDIKDILIDEQVPITDALGRLDRTARKFLIVVSDDERLKAVLTDGDVRRWILKGGNLSSTVSNIMNVNPKYVYEEDIDDALRMFSEYRIEAMPVLDSNNRVVDIVTWYDLNKDKTEKYDMENVPVVIMAGGKGLRLYPYTKIFPKPLIPIGDIPIVERIINKFRLYNAQDFYMTVNYKKNMIKLYFAEISKDFSLKFIDEDKPLGTGGSLYMLKDKLTVPFFVSNCDILLDADYGDIYRHHMESGSLITVVASLKNIMIPYGVIHLNGSNVLDHIDEKPELSYLINTGMYVISPEALKYVSDNSAFNMTDLICIIRNNGGSVGIYPVSEESFMDMGQLGELDKMVQRFVYANENEN